MTRWFLALALPLLVACSSTKPVAQTAPIDPATEPTVIGAVDEAVFQGTIDGEEAARQGRRAGRIAGLFAAVFGGPRHESLDDTIDRYRATRDAVEVTSAIIGATSGAVEGAKRGFQFDLEFAELHKIEGLEVTRPYPDQMDVYIASEPSHEILTAIAAVLTAHEQRAIDIEGPGPSALDLRDSLIDLGVPVASMSAHRNRELHGVLVRIRYRS